MAPAMRWFRGRAGKLEGERQGGWREERGGHDAPPGYAPHAPPRGGYPSPGGFALPPGGFTPPGFYGGPAPNYNSFQNQQFAPVQFPQAPSPKVCFLLERKRSSTRREMGRGK